MTSPWCPSTHAPDGTECVVCGWACPELNVAAEQAALEPPLAAEEVLRAAYGWCAPSGVAW